ncbi:TadE-like protein [Streptomyces sp. 2224.1]|uniref:TadE/TadG family type IV pilus assembly protein n=1 Tax=Streptomyces sp. 2224.1 TaxID=1881020 RepID=UPI0008991807|nr:TadE/TadG family type IV pilus assembly protein [Streptomyces sp. 2224.1]SEB62206.1 TadE-like protein [Streptomyces sp. 2224.1]
MRRPLGGNDRGQVAVEFLGMLPLILLVLALLWQLVLVGYAFSLAAHSADRGARAGTATEGGGAGACQAAAEKELPSSWRGGAGISCHPEAGVWKATVQIWVPVLFPGTGSFPWPAKGSAGAAKEDPR